MLFDRSLTCTIFLLHSYVGEVSLHISSLVIASSALLPVPGGLGLPPYILAIAALGPALEYMLIRYASGVPPLEESADKRFADLKEWHEYKKWVVLV